MKHGFFLGLPGDLPGLALWLKADTGPDINPSNNEINIWYDQSPSQNNAIQQFAKPVLSYLNGQKFVYFDGNAGMIGNNVINSLPCTIITVVNFPVVEEIGVVFQQYAEYGDNLVLYRGFNGGSTRAFRMYNGQNLESTIETNDNETFIMSSKVNGTNSSLYYNGNKISTISTGSTNTDSGNLTPEGIYVVGAWYGGDTGRTSYIGEIIVYNRILSDLELNTVHNYLKHKFRIQ